jgi:hypothetical protein
MERAQQVRQRLAEEYSRGYLAGWRQCSDACVAAVEEELAVTREIWDFGNALGHGPREQN